MVRARSTPSPQLRTRTLENEKRLAEAIRERATATKSRGLRPFMIANLDWFERSLYEWQSAGHSKISFWRVVATALEAAGIRPMHDVLTGMIVFMTYQRERINQRNAAGHSRQPPPSVASHAEPSADTPTSYVPLKGRKP